MVNKGFLSKYYTTCAKGAAMLCVLLSHVANSWGVRWFTPLGGTGVAVFLILSGYGLGVSYDKNGLKSFWKKRFIGAYIPYLLMNILLIVFGQINNLSVKRVILSVFLIEPLHVYWWFMQCLFVWYFIFWAINKLSIFQKTKQTAFLIAGILMFIIVRNGLWSEQSLSFVFGVFLAKNNIDDKKYNIGIIATVLGVTALAIKQIPIIRENADVFYLWHSVQLICKLSLAVGIVCLVSIAMKFRVDKFLYYVGIVSFEIYLIHSYTINFIEDQTIIGYIMFILSTSVGSVLLYFADKYLSQSLLRIAKC